MPCPLAPAAPISLGDPFPPLSGKDFSSAKQYHHKRSREQQQPLGMAPPNVPARSTSRSRQQQQQQQQPIGARTPGESSGLSDSDASSGSPTRRRCFCGRKVVDHGIYCSIDCARSDAFSSLCFKPGSTSSVASSAAVSRQESLGSTVSASSLSRQPSSETTSAKIPDIPDWNASHYRRVARADLRREERREERRRRRAEGSVGSTKTTLSTASAMTASSISSATSRVPDLVGGQGMHSRNLSVASSVASSASSWSSNLSRNPSSASTVSSTSRRYKGDQVEVIHEDNDEEEFLDTRPYPVPSRVGAHHKRNKSGHAKRKIADPMGMGKDMRDILEEIISMEKGFNVDDDDLGQNDVDGDMTMLSASNQPGLFTAAFDRPPRTPSPGPVMGERRKKSVVREAPGAPLRGHRSTFSNPHASPRSGIPQRPPSLMSLHQSSLSESHTALYLATASPVQAASTIGASGRRSASPHLRSRNSLTFTPESAGPVLAFGGGNGGLLSTPSRRPRPQVSPHANYGAMDGWRFPSGSGSSHTAASSNILTPLGLPQPFSATASSSSIFGGGPSSGANTSRFRAPSRQNSGNSSHSTNTIDGNGSGSGSGSDKPERIPPHLLWPPPPMFPQSPGVDTPQFISALSRRVPAGSHRLSPTERLGPGDIHPPKSGMKLGVLLGSGEDVEMDLDLEIEGAVDGEVEVEEESTVDGHAHGSLSGNGLRLDKPLPPLVGDVKESRAYAECPVFLEAEGFRVTRRWG